MPNDGHLEHAEPAPFKVVDRRRFTPSGEVRQGGERALTEDRRRPVPMPPVAKETEQRDASTTAASKAAAPRRSQVDFLAFVASLATNAMAALGLMPDGQPQGMPVNPHLAREYIEIIFMLEERTAGNLTDDEANSLRQLLRDLRLQYVEATRPPQSPPQG